MADQLLYCMSFYIVPFNILLKPDEAMLKIWQNLIFKTTKLCL